MLEKLSHRLVPSELKKRLLCDGSYEEMPLGEHKDINDCLFKRMEPGTEEALAPEIRAVGRHVFFNRLKEGARPLSDVAEGKMTLDEFTSQLSDDELLFLLGGQQNTGVGNVFGFGNMPEYGIPNAPTDRQV